MKPKVIWLICMVGLLASACNSGSTIDPLRRARADGLNKEAFINRYRDPQRCIALSQQALRFIADSLPEYADGELRAHNTMAFALYQMSNADGANAELDWVERRVEQDDRGLQNGEIEQVIAHLLRARLLQRDCALAESYRLLYNIQQSHILEHSRGHLLYNYAQTEYYITMLVLNFHYREGKLSDVLTLIREVEAHRNELKVDYAQDMALNYALAYALVSNGEVERALDYCDRNFDILNLGDGVFCPFHYANTLQMTALSLRRMPGGIAPDTILDLYDEAREVFLDYGDPYQIMGGVSSTARFALLIGDTAFAHEVIGQYLESTPPQVMAPKMEASFYDLLIRSRYAQSADDNLRWYQRRCQLQDHISHNEKADFALQQSIANLSRRNQWMTLFLLSLGTLMVALVVVALLLWRSTKRLRQEKHQLQVANQRDVERIANVETCLSVMRHDVSPFVGYLRNPSLSPEVRNEILQQLLRTFDNIKNWTHLSIPKGLAFSAAVFGFDEVANEVRSQVVPPLTDVKLTFNPSSLQLWADRALVVILLRNLVNNALQHTEKGQVVISAEDAGNSMIDISVSDTGSGMSDQLQGSLFRADRQLPEGSEHGFGLILCRYIVKRHDDNTRRGCKIWAEQREPFSTTIVVRLAAHNNQPSSK